METKTILVDFKIPSYISYDPIISSFDNEIFNDDIVIILSKLIDGFNHIRIRVELSISPPFIGEGILKTSSGNYNATIYHMCDAPMF
jgi:hypothetical protein